MCAFCCGGTDRCRPRIWYLRQFVHLVERQWEVLRVVSSMPVTPTISGEADGKRVSAAVGSVYGWLLANFSSHVLLIIFVFVVFLKVVLDNKTRTI